jgi:hypothetical protein
MSDRWDEIGMTQDEQEALSRRYSNDIIILLPLKSGNIAVFNNESRKLLSIISREARDNYGRDCIVTSVEWIRDYVWQKPTPAPTIRNVDLEELGLL